MILINNIALTWLLKRRLSQESNLLSLKGSLIRDPNEGARIKMKDVVLYAQLPIEIFVICMFLVLIYNGTSEKKMYSPKVLILMTVVSFVDILVHMYTCYLVNSFKSFNIGEVWNRPGIILITTCSLSLFNQLSFYFSYVIQSKKRNFLQQISKFFEGN
jgi:hypothetical protein